VSRFVVVALLGAVGGSAQIGCDEVGPRDREAVAPAPAVLPSARRPTRKFYFARTTERCEVYWHDGEEISSAEPHPCVRELEPGERIRLVGKTCIRESTVTARQVPVLCPDPLTAAERDWIAERTDAGQE
jgi:hypothetical protein